MAIASMITRDIDITLPHVAVVSIICLQTKEEFVSLITVRSEETERFFASWARDLSVWEAPMQYVVRWN